MSIKFINSNGEEIPVSGGGSESSGGIPIGTGMDYFGLVEPENYMFADGRAISRIDYAELFEILGTAYGAGDGSTTFNLPDKRQRVTIMKNNSDTLGQVKGENTHTLIKEEIPNYTLYNAAHTHTQNAHTHTQNSHTHSFSASTGNATANGTMYAYEYAGSGVGSGHMSGWSTQFSSNHATISSGNTTFPGAYHKHSISGNTGGTTATDQNTTATNQNTTITVTSGGSGVAMNNMQESLVCNYIIKVK